MGIPPAIKLRAQAFHFFFLLSLWLQISCSGYCCSSVDARGLSRRDLLFQKKTNKSQSWQKFPLRVAWLAKLIVMAFCALAETRGGIQAGNQM